MTYHKPNIFFWQIFTEEESPLEERSFCFLSSPLCPQEKKLLLQPLLLFPWERNFYSWFPRARSVHQAINIHFWQGRYSVKLAVLPWGNHIWTEPIEVGQPACLLPFYSVESSSCIRSLLKPSHIFPPQGFLTGIYTLRLTFKKPCFGFKSTSNSLIQFLPE